MATARGRSSPREFPRKGCVLSPFTSTRRRLPKRLMDGKLGGGEDPGKGRPEQNWMDCLKDDFQAFGVTDGSTVDNRLTFGVDRAVWTLAAKMDGGAPWHKGVLRGAENP